MKKLIGYGTVAAIVIAGALLNHRNNTLLSLDEKQSLHDAVALPMESPVESKEFSAVKPVEFHILSSSNICHQIVPTYHFPVYWDADSQKVGVGAANGTAPVLTFKLVQNTSLIVREDQFGGIWDAAGHKPEVSHAFRPLHKGYLLGYTGYNCWHGGKNELIGMALVTEENEEIAKALHDMTWQSPPDRDAQSLKKHKSLMLRILESLRKTWKTAL